MEGDAFLFSKSMSSHVRVEINQAFRRDPLLLIDNESLNFYVLRPILTIDANCW